MTPQFMAALFRRATPVVLAFGLQATSALALGTAFTYQGTLGEGGSPANGNYDLTFSLYNAASAGTQVGSTVTNKAVAVTNGLFAVTVDFGAVFDGTQLWVQMGVRTNGGGSFTTLTPRQELTPTPYALYSPNAGVAVTADTATAVAAGSVSSGSIQAGSIMASNLNLTNVTAALGGPFWSLAGNAGTTPGVNFVGTTDNEALQLDAAGVRGLQLQYVSRVSAPPLLYRQSGMNVIGGFWGNSIASTVIGGTVAGGGDAAGFFPVTGYPNTVTNDFGTVGGGYANTAGYAGTVPGGYNNIASGTASFAAGAFAEATNNYSFCLERRQHALQLGEQLLRHPRGRRHPCKQQRYFPEPRERQHRRLELSHKYHNPTRLARGHLWSVPLRFQRRRAGHTEPGGVLAGMGLARQRLGEQQPCLRGPEC